MEPYLPYLIKSFKHDGHLHRVWKENWLIPTELLHPLHRSWLVMINEQTKIVESDGKEWVSRIPGVSFFIPKVWYNIIALVENQAIRYYCNIASPPYDDGKSVNYIDYDLDVVVWSSKQPQILDELEYETHKRKYHYSETVQTKVQDGMDELLERIQGKHEPFLDERIYQYYEDWKHLKLKAEHP